VATPQLSVQRLDVLAEPDARVVREHRLVLLEEQLRRRPIGLPSSAGTRGLDGEDGRWLGLPSARAPALRSALPIASSRAPSLP
jgi:hypothetical protein